MDQKLLTWMSCALFLTATACSSNPHKAEEIETEMDRRQEVSGEYIGTKDGEMKIQKKELLAEKLRRLQYEVYEMEDKVYGNIKYGSKGLYGRLKKCRRGLSDKRNGGDGKLTYLEPIDRVTDKEDEFAIGVDENDKLVAVKEEYLVDRIKRFQGYRTILRKRFTEYQEKVEICEADLKARKYEVQKNAAND